MDCCELEWQYWMKQPYGNQTEAKKSVWIVSPKRLEHVCHSLGFLVSKHSSHQRLLHFKLTQISP